ncbi:ankyrin-2-like isoform X3 [Synchiropus splendidus]|uniref:ankyrin-2-like isoform X3 n=1 Tax=Synchiropus splendidus TaxID=270530 RepID=UPI00237D7701|nr:ankyrin-2-like isoform X3 [Synchiropus splendidus]
MSEDKHTNFRLDPSDHLNVLGPRRKRPKKLDSNTSFLRAARAGNIEKVVEYLKGGVDIRTCNQNGLNALHLAAKEGHMNLVLELLDRGAVVDAATKKGNTALHISSLAGQAEVAKTLVINGADINAQSQNGFTPLYMAAQENHIDVVRYLLENGGNQSTATEDGFTPLAIALQQGHNQVVSILLENDTKGKVRLPALHIAARKDDTKSAALLLQNDHNADIQSKMMVNRTTEPLLSKQFCTQLSCTKSDLHCQNGKSGFTPLHIAAHYGNVNVATLLLNRGAAVDFSARNGITPLHVASKRGNTNMVRLLLDRGSQIDAKTRDGLTPLHCASRSGHSMVVELLLEREAPLFARTKNGLSALHMAAQGDHVECVKHILKKAPVDDVTLDYLTALHVSAHCGHYRVTKLLLDKMANPNARALNGFTPLHIACKKNRVKVMELLVKYGASIQAITESGLTPIHVAAFMGHLNIVLLLLQHGASPDASNIRGETSVHMAARAGQVEVVRCLLRNGAQVDATARENQTPLHIASRLGKADIVQLLLQHMANPDAATANGYTALHITAREGQVGTALVLLEAGASHSLATKKGFTPLHIAAKYGSLDVAELLLQCCAASDSAGKSGLTPLHVAAHYDNQRVALLLLDKGASPHAMAKNGYTPLHIAAKKNQMEIATVLVKYGAETNIQTKQGVTPLHLASEQGHDHMASLLLSNGAQVNIPTKVMYRRKSTCNVTELLINTIPVFLQSGLTALHLAAQEEKVAVAKILVSYGANINEPTKLQYSPLIVASHYGNVKMVNFLLQKGADVLAKTKNGYTALHQAAQQGNTHIINVLLQYGAKPDAVTANGNTALGIARRLGYISVVDTLRVITEETITTTTTVTEKHKLNVPETMTEVLDVSDEEGDDTITGDGRDYLRAEDLQELGDDSLPGQYGMNYLHFNPLGVYTESHQGPCRPSTKRDGVLDDMITSHHEERNSYDVGCGTENPDNVVLSLSPVSTGFLVSFMVDARGGAMCGCRQNGLRIIIPPKKCSAPTRVTCRLVKRHRLATMPPMLKGDSLSSRLVEVGTSGPKFLGKLHLPSTPPPLNEGESLVSRILQLGPPGTKFLGPVVVEIPHFASLRGKERELVILRSDTGESWKEHHSEHTHEELHLMLKGMNLELDKPDSLQRKRICIIVTRDFPQYFAVVSRVKQDCSFIGPEGGVLSSSVVPKVQAVFPAGALTKRIKVGLQAQPANKDLVQKVLGNKAILSPIVTLEPRRRKFHKPISMTIPVPKSSSDQGCKDYVGERPTLRLLCSITGGTTPAQWEDITGTTPLTFVNDCISFTTNVSARFWLIDCRQVLESVTYATQVYRKVICVPYMARFVVFAKIHDSIEARLRCFCVTDDKIDKTLEHQENFAEVARSREVEVLEGEPIYADCFGNLVPLTKSGQHHLFNFFAFKENRLALFVKVRDNIQEPCGRLCFTKEPRNRSPTGNSICNLNINLDSRCQDPDSDQLDETRRTQVKYEDSMTSVHHDPDLLSDLSKMKQDLIKMSAILTAESTEKFHTLQGPALVGGSVEVSEEPLEIMEKDLEQVKEDLEKVSKILRSGSFESGTSSRGNDCTYISNSDSDKPILLGSHPKFVTTRLKDVKEIDELQECRIDAKFKVKKNSQTENLKPQVQSHVKSNANACNVKKQARKGNSTHSANAYMVKPEQSPELHVSPNVEVTPIGSTKDTVKALQVKMENEQWQKKTMVIGGKHVSCKPRTTNESTILKQTLAKTTKVGEKHSPTQTMSVKAIIQAFQAPQVSSKNKFVPCELKTSTTEATSDVSLLVPVFESEVLSYDIIPLEIENVQSISHEVFEMKSVPSETADTCTSVLDEGSVSAKDEDAAKSFGTSSGHCGVHSPCSDSYKENTQATSPHSASISSQIGQKKKDSGGSEAPLLVTPCHTLVTEFTKQITLTKADDENGRESPSAIYVKPNLSGSIKVIERVSDTLDSSFCDDDWQVSASSSVQFKLPLHQDSDSLSDRADHSMTISLKDSLDGSPLMEESSSYKSPDSIEPSPTKDSPPHDSLENSPHEKIVPSPFPSILSDPSKTIVKPQDAVQDNLDNNDAQFISEEKMLAIAEQFSEQESENKCNDESDTETDGTELLQPIHECALSIDCEMNIPSEDVGIVHCVSTSIYTQHTSPFSAGLHEESRKKEVDKHAAAYITSGEPHVQQTEVKTHSEEAEDEQLDVIVINENRLSMHIGHSLWKTRETIEDGRELLVNNIDKTICNISDEKQEETKRPKPIENSAKEQNIQTESRGVTAVISADFVPCATQDELRDLNLALGDGSLEITPQTTPGRTPTEESTPNSEPSSFLFQEGKLFEMTRSGAIDMTKRNYEEEGPGFAFFQIGEQPFEEIQDNEQAVRSAASPPQVGLNLTLQFKEQEHDNLKRKTTSQPVVDVDIPCKREASECKMPEMCNFGTGSSITLNQITTRDGAVEINAFESSYESIIEHIHTTETTVVRALPPEHSLEEAQAAVQASTPLGMPKQSTSCGTTKIPDKIQAKSVYHSRANYTNASPSKKDSSSGAVSKSKIPIKVNYAKPDLHIKCSESKQHKKDKAAIKMDTRRKSVTEEGSALDVKTKTLSSKSQSFCKEDLTKSSPTKSTGSPTTVHSTSSRRFQSKLPLRHKSVLSATSQTPPKHSSDFLKQNSFSMEEISGKEQLTLAKTEHELLKTGAHSGLIDTSFLVSDSCSKAQDTSSGDIFPSRVVQYPSKPQMHQIPDDKVQSQALYGKSAQSGSSVTIIPDEEVQSSLLCLQQTAAPSATDVTPTDCLNNIQLGSLQVHSEPKHTPKAGCEEFNDLVPEEGATLNPDV